MAIRWSHEASCYTWSCIWGHYGFDHESSSEAENAFLSHACDGAA